MKSFVNTEGLDVDRFTFYIVSGVTLFVVVVDGDDDVGVLIVEEINEFELDEFNDDCESGLINFPAF